MIYWCSVIVVAWMSALVALMYIRKRQYKYNTQQDYCYDFKETAVIDVDKAVDLSVYREDSSIIVRLSLKAKLCGHFFQPYVQIVSGDYSEKTYIEHGLRGERYIDMSGFVGCGTITFKFRHCSPISSRATVYSFQNPTIEDKKVLILAPHADDAEVAAFGLYSSAKESYIVTTTVGEGHCDYCGLIDDKREQAIKKGHLRIHDALSVAGLGGVPQNRCVMLGYFCKTLKWMYHHQDKPAFSESTGIGDINFFRRVDHATFECNSTPSATWSSLVEDLYCILESIQPDLVVTPHPMMDAHGDHQYTTYALLEAMQKGNFAHVPILSYTNHHIYNDAYPYGTMFSTSALAPKFKQPFACGTVFSYRLSKTKQYDKFYALEAMHDLRNSLLVIGVQRAWSHFVKKLKREIQQRDKSYYRRAIRPNELFYVTTLEELRQQG